MPSSASPPVFNRALWQVTQYRLMRAAGADGGRGPGSVICCARGANGGYGGNGKTQRNRETETKRRRPTDFSVVPPLLRFSVVIPFSPCIPFPFPPSTPLQ